MGTYEDGKVGEDHKGIIQEVKTKTKSRQQKKLYSNIPLEKKIKESYRF